MDALLSLLTKQKPTAHTVIAGKTAVTLTLTATAPGSEAGILLGDPSSRQSPSAPAYCLAVSANALTLYRILDTATLLAARRIRGITEGHPLRLRLETDGKILRAYLPDNTDETDPWPVIELPIAIADGTAVSFTTLSGACEFSAPETSFGMPLSEGNTYTNPIYLTYADPDVHLYDGIYYLYATGGAGGYRVHTSDDLVHWTDRGVCASFGLFGKTRWFWAPDVEKINGRFYMVTSCDETLGIAVADSPLGPFKGITEESLYVKSIDGHLFVDSDGRIYLYFVSWRKTYGIYGVELDPETMLPRPETETLIIKPTEPWEKDRGNVTEGPYLLKHNGLYYMTYSGSHFQSPAYAVGYAVSDSPLGTYQKYESNPIMIGNAFVHGVGHHCIVTDKNGKMWIVYHCHKEPGAVQPRNVCIDRIRFLPDPDGGIDRLEVYGPTVTPQ